MNSPNLQPRQFVHNTCELSIDDKKSPFPAWMKFNKPNPLRFSLTVNDPDRPELEPMRVEGDRTKLEALHHTVEDYVKDLVSRAPLPQINGEDIGKLPQSAAFDDTISSSDLQHRPIDALKVSDEKPRIEPDGLSRHLFYLGSGADANTTTMSLSTLQLFDLSSALNEGMTPVIEPEVEPEKPVALASEAETIVQPVVLPPEAVTNNKSSLNTSLKSGQSDVQEPRVVLPSANAPESSGKSEDLYGLETESSILERSSSNKDRFKMPKPSLGSLNLPELPDFSRSPLTSIPLWLGLGGMVALIFASPFLMSQFKGGNSVAKKPPTPTTQVANASTDISPTPYQPNDPTVPSGVGIPAPNLSNPAPANQGGLGTAGNPNSLGITPGILGQTPNTAQNRTSVPPTVNTAGNNTGVGNSTGINPSSRNPFNNGQQTNLNNPNNQPGNNAAAREKARQDQLAAANGKKPNKFPDAANQSSASKTTAQSNRENVADNYDSRLRIITGEEAATPTKRGSRNSARPQQPLVGSPEPIEASPITVGQGSNLGSGGSGFFGAPLPTPQIDSPGNLEAPIISSDSVQAKGLQGYFQKIWRADPKFDSSLQYKVNVGRNGRVISVEGSDENSKTYLNKTNFLKPGAVVSSSGQKDQKILLMLHSTGDVQTFSEEE